jgi:predicted MFS family arabinose efflux permease
MLRICDPMLPALAHHFNVPTALAALTVSSYAIAYGLLQFFFDPMGDRWGKLFVIGYAALGCVAGNLLCLFSANLETLIAGRVLSGAMAAGTVPLAVAWVGDTVAFEMRQTVLARLLSASLMGMIVGQWAAGALTEAYGWRSIFGLVALIYLVSGLIVVLSSSSLDASRPSPVRNGFLPQLRNVASVPWVRLVVLLVAVEGALAFGALAFVPTYLVTRFGISLTLASGIVAAYGLGGLVYAIGARWLWLHFKEHGLALGGGFLLATFWLTMAFAPVWWASLLAFLLGGLGFYAMHGVLQMQATQMAPEGRGTAMGLFASSMMLGISTGVVGASWLIERVGYQRVFIACAIDLFLLGAAITLSLRHRPLAMAHQPAASHFPTRV